jgi:hypothetical protein
LLRTILALKTITCDIFGQIHCPLPLREVLQPHLINREQMRVAEKKRGIVL